jgi:hypothetical protein
VEALPWDQIQSAVFYLALPAFVSAALVTAALHWLGGVKQSAAGAALGLCVGAVAALFVHSALPALLADQTESALASLGNALLPGAGSTLDRLAWTVLAALVVDRIACVADAHSADGWLIRGGASLGIAWALVPEATRDEFIWLAPALAAVTWAHWTIFNILANRPGRISLAVCVVLSLFAGAELLGMHAHSARLMDMLAALAFALAGLVAVSWWRGMEFGGALPGIAVSLPTLMLIGQQTTSSELHWFNFALSALVPLTLAVTIPFKDWPTTRLGVVRLTLVLVVLAGSAIMAWQAEPLTD